MEEIKELVAQALEQKRVLSKLKAELRFHVFLTIDEQERKSGNPGLAHKTDNPRRSSLLSTDTGTLLVGLVREFLEWSGMAFTLKVFEPEMGLEDSKLDVKSLARQLGVSDVSHDAPLLMTLLQQWEHGTGDTEHIKAVPQPTSRPPLTSLPATNTKGLGPLPTPIPAPAIAPLRSTFSAAAASAPPASAPAPALQAAEHSYADDIDIDDDLDGAEILDEDEDYASTFVRKQRSSGGGGSERGSDRSGAGAGAAGKRRSSSSNGTGALPPATRRSSGGGGSAGAGGHSSELEPENIAAHPGRIPPLTSSKPYASAAAGGGGHQFDDELEVSGGSLSGSVPPGRLRPARHARGRQDDPTASGGGAHPGLSGDLSAGGGGGGDRSLGLSQDMAGLSPPAAAEHTQSTAWSYDSQDTPHGDASRGAAGKLDGLPGSGPLLKPPLPKLGALAPLAKAPSSSLPSASGLTPLGSATSGARPDAKDIKAELRKAGLLHSDSYSADTHQSSHSGSSSDGGLELPDNTPEAAQSRRRSTSGGGSNGGLLAEGSARSNGSSMGGSNGPGVLAPVRRSGSHSGSGTGSRGSAELQSLEVRSDRSSSGGGGGGGVGGARDSSSSQRSSASGDGVSVGQQSSDRSGSSRSSGQGSGSSGGGSSAGGAPGKAQPASGLRVVKGGVYDAEVSVSQSMEIPVEIDETDVRSSFETESLVGARPGAGPGFLGSKLSMDMRDTGLSTSDKSGDLDKLLAHADFAETAEWS